MAITFETPELQTSEALKAFETPDALAKSYLELHTKVSGGSIDLLPEEMRKDPTISVFKTLPELAKGFVETKKLVGGIEKAPADPKEYKFTPVEKVHANLKAEAIQNNLRVLAHKHGLGNKAADGFQQDVVNMLSQVMEKADALKKENAQKTETLLRQEWAGDYDKKVDSIVKVMVAAGGQEVMNETEAIRTALKGSPNFLKVMGKVVGMLSEDAIGSLGDVGDVQISDKDGAQKRINEIIANPELRSAIMDEKNPKHKEAKTEWDNLQAMLLK